MIACIMLGSYNFLSELGPKRGHLGIYVCLKAEADENA